MITAMGKDCSDKDSLTAKIIGACYHVHNKLGPGFVERIYLNALKIALKKLGGMNEFMKKRKDFQFHLKKKLSGSKINGLNHCNR